MLHLSIYQLQFQIDSLQQSLPMFSELKKLVRAAILPAGGTHSLQLLVDSLELNLANVLSLQRTLDKLRQELIKEISEQYEMADVDQSQLRQLELQASWGERLSVNQTAWLVQLARRLALTSTRAEQALRDLVAGRLLPVMPVAAAEKEQPSKGTTDGKI